MADNAVSRKDCANAIRALATCPKKAAIFPHLARLCHRIGCFIPGLSPLSRFTLPPAQPGGCRTRCWRRHGLPARPFMPTIKAGAERRNGRRAAWQVQDAVMCKYSLS